MKLVNGDMQVEGKWANPCKRSSHMCANPRGRAGPGPALRRVCARMTVLT